jgi:hypothetical protein
MIFSFLSLRARFAVILSFLYVSVVLLFFFTTNSISIVLLQEQDLQPASINIYQL